MVAEGVSWSSETIIRLCCIVYHDFCVCDLSFTDYFSVQLCLSKDAPKFILLLKSAAVWVPIKQTCSSYTAWKARKSAMQMEAKIVKSLHFFIRNVAMWSFRENLKKSNLQNYESDCTCQILREIYSFKQTFLANESPSTNVRGHSNLLNKQSNDWIINVHRRSHIKWRNSKLQPFVIYYLVWPHPSFHHKNLLTYSFHRSFGVIIDRHRARRAGSKMSQMK